MDGEDGCVVVVDVDCRRRSTVAPSQGVVDPGEERRLAAVRRYEMVDSTPEEPFAATAMWNELANPCGGDTPGLVSIAAVATSTGFLCIGQGSSGQEPKRLLVSTDDGRTTRLAGAPPMLGDGGTLGALNPTTWVIANASAASWICRSTDRGSTWTATVTFNDGGTGFSDFGLTTASQGIAIHGPYVDTPQLIVSRDGATTWQPVIF